jgi:hypothetical protein
MADLDALTSFPDGGDDPRPGEVVEFCQVRLVNAEDKHVEDVGADASPREDGGEVAYPRDVCVELIFFTASGEASRYVDDGRSEYVEDVMKRVLYTLGRKGWRAITVTVDEENDEVWHLQRVRSTGGTARLG